MNKNIIQTIIIVISLMIRAMIFIYASANKQEPIQQILNQIEINNIELNSLEQRQNQLNQQNEEAKARLMNEFGLQIIQEEKIVEEWKPGDLTEDGSQQEMPVITGSNNHERFKELATAYGLEASQIRAVEDHYKIKEGVILCITVAETSGGNRGYGGKNIGSVGSNDRGDRPTYALMESGLEAIGKTLNNKYLGKKQTLGCLSNAGSCKEANDNGSRYATSNGNRERNMVACLSTIYGSVNASEFNIRR